MRHFVAYLLSILCYLHRMSQTYLFIEKKNTYRQGYKRNGNNNVPHGYRMICEFKRDYLTFVLHKTRIIFSRESKTLQIIMKYLNIAILLAMVWAGKFRALLFFAINV